jgi:FkbM family methyltransferase
MKKSIRRGSELLASSRTILWHLWEVWDRTVPIERGKQRMAAILTALAGCPVRDAGGVRLELSPASSSDRWMLEKKLGDDNPIRAAMKEFLRPGQVFIDVGANIGWYSILAAVQHGAEAYAFEPSQRELARLKRNAALNRVGIRTFAVALGDVDGECSLMLATSGSHTLNRIGAAEALTPNGVTCEMRRLDTVLGPETLRRTGLVKIDVEGYEMNVLRGMEGAFEHLRQSAMVVEVTPKWLIKNGSSAAELYAYLIRRGWRPRGSLRLKKQWDEVFAPPTGQGAR